MNMRSVIALVLTTFILGCSDPIAPSDPGINTPGAEGALTVWPAADSMVARIGDIGARITVFRVSASGSDLEMKRVVLLIKSSAPMLRSAFTKIFLVDDDGRVIASSDLRNVAATTRLNGSEYFDVVLEGVTSIIRKDDSRFYTVKADISNSTQFSGTANVIMSQSSAVSAMDGAGINLYGPDRTIMNPLIISH